MISLEALAELLKRPGYSQAGLAQALGKTAPVVSRILAGTRQIKASEIPIIEEYLRVGSVTVARKADTFFLSLGQAVEAWNRVESSIERLICALIVEPKDTTITSSQAAVLFRAIATPAEKIRAADLICLEALQPHRNEAETWKSLSQRLTSASHRRQAHQRIMVMGEDSDNNEDLFYGFTNMVPGADNAANISSEALCEDARLFRDLSYDVSEFSGVSDRLKLKDRRGHRNTFD